MDFLVSALLVIGIALAVAGWCWLIFLAFQVSFLWGIGSLIPLILLVFVIEYWNDVKRPFAIWIAGQVVIFFAKMLTSGS